MKHLLDYLPKLDDWLIRRGQPGFRGPQVIDWVFEKRVTDFSAMTNLPQSLRELLAAHREAAICASCHDRMDPLGLALENFNALGIWRETEKGQPIEPAGTLITGESFDDITQLKKVLREKHAGDFYRCVTEKLLTYALGRGIEYTDEHSVDLIVNEDVRDIFITRSRIISTMRRYFDDRG